MHKNKKMLRGKIFGLRLNRIEQAKLEIASNEKGLTPSAYVRKIIFDE